MGRPSHARELGLWMNGAFVGTWSIQSHYVDQLAYDSEWMASAQGRPLSLSLPFTPDNAPHRGPAVCYYFENLLPDSKPIRERIAGRFGVGSTDAFDLLSEIGRDCVGALQILPKGVAPAEMTPIQATPLDEAAIARLLRATTTPTPLGRHEEPDEFRISIAGAQEKTALLRCQDNWCLPYGATPSTHIFKLPLGLVGGLQFDMRDSVENEWLCSRILDAYGLPVAECEPLQFEDVKVLAVRRFDRSWWKVPARGDQQLIRLPQEDMCQVKGISPEAKYEADGGPGVDDIMGILNGSTNREADRRTFFQAQVIFWMLCATDGHAKNFSIFLRPGGRYALTPLYDVLSAYPVMGKGAHQLSPLKARMAMAVRARNAHWKQREILRRHWIELGARHGVVGPDGQPAQFVVDELAARTPHVIDMVRAQLPDGFPAHVAESILEGLHEAANQLAGQE
ncbi:MAG TPA: type II toxin-antitoxin system HipA family toxin [Rhodocyclaceae bacterium]|nr:type II toxin-antitoxin system HipA family toxin [Rhodocyclaceae bacterium]